MDRSAIEPEVLSGGGVSFRGAWSVYELIGPEAEAAVFGQSFLMPTWLTSVLSLTHKGRGQVKSSSPKSSQEPFLSIKYLINLSVQNI